MRPRLNLVGQTVGRLTITQMVVVPGKPTRCVAQCVCGTVKELSVSCMLHGKTRSCGCLRNERVIATHTVHGLSNHPAYDVWRDIQRRCLDKHHPNYRLYGERGIQVCRAWHRDNPNGLKNFCAWYDRQRPKAGLTVDRRNNDRGYSPQNCRLATAKQQAQNRRKRSNPRGLG